MLPAPTEAYDIPLWSDPKVHRDHFAQVAKALYSLPTRLIGKTLRARADRHLVCFYNGAILVKTHPRQPPGGKSIDRSDFPEHKTPYALRDVMNETSAPLPHGESEFEKFQIASAPSTLVRPPRVAAAPVAFECRLDRIVIIGDDGPLSGNVVFGTVLCAHVSESVLTNGAIDPRKLDTIGRMGGDYYTRTTELFTIKRPA